MIKIGLKQTKDTHIQYRIEDIEIQTPYELYETQHTYISYILRCLNNKTNALIQSPTGTGKTMSLLCSTLGWLMHYQQKNPQCTTRIIYTSRTHAQLKQVVSELSRLSYDVKISILSSRDHSCINPDLQLLKERDKELECRMRVANKNGKYCKYLHTQRETDVVKMKELPLGKVIDLEGVNLRGKADCFCPFYYSRFSRSVAHLILMPYNYLFDNSLWEQEGGISLYNSIIIFDYAHNIQSVAEQSKEFSISHGTIDRAILQISELREQKLNYSQTQSTGGYETGQSGLLTNLEDLSINAAFMNCLKIYLEEFYLTADLSGKILGAPYFMESLNKFTQKCPFGSILGKIDRLSKSFTALREDLSFRPFWAVEHWIKFIYAIKDIPKSIQEGYKYSRLTVQVVLDGSDIKVNIYCLDPADGFRQIAILKPRSIILTSGTLSPLRAWSIYLNIPFAEPVSCPHILSKYQVNALIITHGPSTCKMYLSFYNRDNIQLYEDIGKTLLSIIQHTPNGVIVFFSSYQMLYTTKRHLFSLNILEKIHNLKDFYYEKRDSTGFKLTLESYFKSAEKQKGAVLFALIRGKISEGLDFSHEKCRAVVVVGVPFPAARDVKVEAKRKYLDVKASKHPKECLTGSQWYMTETIRSLNQAMGRIVRNKSDYGAVYLIDSRFGQTDIMNQISSWVRYSLVVCKNFAEFYIRIRIITEFRNKINHEDNIKKEALRSYQGTEIGPYALLQTIKTVKGSISISLEAQKNQIGETVPRKYVFSLKDYLQYIKYYKAAETESIPFVYKTTEPYPRKTNRTESIFKPRRQLPVDECVVCLEKRYLIKNIVCVHMFCEECWQKCLKLDLRCPVCRIRVRYKYLMKY